MPTLYQPKLPRVKFLEGTPGERWMPSNGTCGEYFWSMWCEECARDKVMNGEATVEQADKDPSLYCDILSRSFREDSLPEWVYGDDGQPKCTAFVPQGEDVKPRCSATLELPLETKE